MNNISIEKNLESNLPSNGLLEIGLSWDSGSDNIDLDLTIMVFNDNGQLIDTIYFNKRSSNDGSINHSGDEKSGKTEGIDEKISVDLNKLSTNSKIKAVVLLVNSLSEKNLNNVKSSKVLIAFEKQVFTTLNCSEFKGDNYTFLPGVIYRANDLTWKIRNISEGSNSKNFTESIPFVLGNLKFLIDPVLMEEAKAWNINTSKSYNLKKDESVYLADCLDKVAMGLGWETQCDIDSSVITIDSNFNMVEYIYYGNRTSRNGSIFHKGDNTTGIGKGDDERILININQIESNVIYFACTINVYTSGKTFNDVTDAYCRLIDNQSEREFFKFRLDETGENRTCLLCYFTRDFITGKWKVTACGKFGSQFSPELIVNEVKSNATTGKSILTSGNARVRNGVNSNYNSNSGVNMSSDNRVRPNIKKDNDCCIIY